MKIALPILVALLAAACGSSPSRTAPTAPAPSAFTLSGTITSGGTPIATATIAIIDGPNALKVMTTGANGLYQFAGLQPGGFTAVIGALGYQTTTRAVALTADTVLNVELVR
jgi:Carboxypeptidase regulatory-like domain